MKRGRAAPSRAIVQEVATDKRGTRNVRYQLELVRCGKTGCQCTRGKRHGPYWSAYWTHRGVKWRRYIGVELKLLTLDQLRTLERDEYFRRRREAKRKAKSLEHNKRAIESLRGVMEAAEQAGLFVRR